MKKLTLFFTFLFAISVAFNSCRDNAEGTNEVLDDDYATEDEVFDDEVVMTGFGDYDLDDDGLLDANEFGDAYEEDWATWDVDDDDYLDDTEFYSTTYGWVDADDDGLIDETEWDEGYTNLYGDYGDTEDFALYDVNDDNYLDEEEWYEGWADSEWYNDFDLDDDELVNNNEWNEGLFANWDEDDDGFWDEDEYNTYTAYNETW